MKHTFDIRKPYIMFSLLRWYLRRCKTILDIGCGPHSVLCYLTHKKEIVGVDAYEPNRFLAIKNGYAECIVADVTELDFITKSFDAITILQTLEHIEKAKAIELLDWMEKVVRKCVVIYVPNGFLPHEAKENPYMKHLSGWVAKEFVTRGYKVYGMMGHRSFWKDEKLKGNLFLWLLSQCITLFWPEVADHLFAVKEIQNETT